MTIELPPPSSPAVDHPSPVTLESLWLDWAAYDRRAKQVYWDRSYPACRSRGPRKAVCLLPPDHAGDHYGNGYDQYGPLGPNRWRPGHDDR